MIDTVEQLVDRGEQVAVVTITGFERDPNVRQVHNDARLQFRLVHATVDTAIKNTARSEALTFIHGEYSRFRRSPTEDYGEEHLLLPRDAPELEVGDTAVVGTFDGGLLSSSVIRVEGDTVTDAAGLDGVTEGQAVDTLASQMSQLATEPAQTG